MTCRNSHQKYRAFTLLEILIVVLILGILATITIPRFASASQDAKISSIKSTLHSVRTQIEVFKTEHNGIPPQRTGMWNLLLRRSNTTETSVANPTGTAHGPYLQTVPLNPWNNRTGVSTRATDTTMGWYYTASTTTYTFQVRSTNGTRITTY